MTTIGIIGSGVVGEATGLAFAEKGLDVVFHDVSGERLRRLSKVAKTDISLSNTIRRSDAVFVCVPTPTVEDRFDSSYLQSVTEDIRGALEESPEPHHIIVYKSTSLPGYTRRKIYPLLKHALAGHSLANNPEFLTEKYALEDAMHPSRVVMGLLDRGDDYAQRALSRIYAPFNAPIFFTTLEEAEMVKYWANLTLATRISFTNEMGAICDKLGVDANYVSSIVRLDPRIGVYGSAYGQPYGGTCLPKDLNALLTYCKEDLNMAPELLEAVRKVNRNMGGE